MQSERKPHKQEILWVLNADLRQFVESRRPWTQNGEGEDDQRDETQFEVQC